MDGFKMTVLYSFSLLTHLSSQNEILHAQIEFIHKAMTTAIIIRIDNFIKNKKIKIRNI